MIEGCVRRDDACHSVFGRYVKNCFQFDRREIRRNFDEHRFRRYAGFVVNRAQQLLEFLRFLQVAQPGGVGRAYIQRDVIGKIVK